MFLLSRGTVHIYQERAGLPSHGTGFLVYGVGQRNGAPRAFLAVPFFSVAAQHSAAFKGDGDDCFVQAGFILLFRCYIAGYGGWVVDCPIIIVLFATWPQVYGFV